MPRPKSVERAMDPGQLLQKAFNFISSAGSLSVLFLGFLTSGVLYSLVMVLLGGGGESDDGGHGGFHLGDLLGGHNDSAGGVTHVHTGPVHVNFLSPLSLSAFMTGFGASGLIYLQALTFKPMTAIFAAFFTALVFDFVAYGLVFRFFMGAQASSLISSTDIVGLDGEVITSMAQGRLGQVAYNTKVGRQVGIARARDGTDIPTGTVVKILEIVGNTLLVERKESAKENGGG
ncbi:MAG: NfeD family protein [Armatimonadetes bacterium]|nr:NfeD family protein [Armatimonadota bacterium]